MPRHCLPAICLISGMVFVLCPQQGAAAQRMRDMSLPPDESLTLPNVSHSPAGYPVPYGGDTSSYPDQTPYGTGRDGYPYQPEDKRGHRFMDSYCDSNFKPLASDNPRLASMQSCIAEQKRTSCDTFRQLPPDAQRVLDEAIACVFSAANGDDTQMPVNSDACVSSDSSRLQLLKKYGQDQTVSRALIFMPDDVVGASGKCVGGR